MTIEELLELPTIELEALANNSVELEKHFGWCLSITRPSEEGKARLLAGSKKPIKPTNPKKLQKAAAAGQLEAARLNAIALAKSMGIELKLPPTS